MLSTVRTSCHPNGIFQKANPKRWPNLSKFWLLFSKDFLFVKSYSPAATLGSWLRTWVPRWRLAKCTSGMKRTGWVSRSIKGLKIVMSIRLWEGSSGTLTSETGKKWGCHNQQLIYLHWIQATQRFPQRLRNLNYTTIRYRSHRLNYEENRLMWRSMLSVFTILKSIEHQNQRRKRYL